MRHLIFTLTTMVFLLFASMAQAEEKILPAQRGDFTLRVEPSLAVPLTESQSERFDIGGSLTVKALWNITRYLDLGPSITFLGLPAASKYQNPGTAWAFGPSLRLKRPHDAPGNSFYAISPWVDVDLLYVRTDDLNRFGFAFAAGLSIPIDHNRVFWIGPFVRYLHVLQQPERGGYDNRDAKILLLGISLEVGTGVKRKQVRPEPKCLRCVIVKVEDCPDRDKDGLPDDKDRCPDVAGPIDNWGCPKYDNVVITPTKLELKDRIYFLWDQAVIQDVSFPVLDDVVRALKDNKNFRVQIEGHASIEGTDEHNQVLSEQRAEAVLEYIVSHGISKDRLTSKGFGSTVPSSSNDTVAGREKNRRVEFVVHLIITDKGTK